MKCRESVGNWVTQRKPRRARQLGLSQNIPSWAVSKGDRDVSLLNLIDHKGGASKRKYFELYLV